MDEERRSRMSDELMRLSTFWLWRTMDPYPVYPTILANLEFFATGRGDEVECFRCGARISNWRPGDDPTRRHPPVCIRRPTVNRDRRAIFLEETTGVHLTTLSSYNSNRAFNGVGLVNNWYDTMRDSVSRDPNNSASHFVPYHCCPFQCSVCFEKKISVVFKSCRHACCCFSCSENCTACPMCRGSIKEKLPISLPNCSHNLP